MNAGGNIEFTVTVTTNGPGPSPNVVLKDTLPAGFTWTVGGANAADCQPTGAGIAGATEVTCNFGHPVPGLADDHVDRGDERCELRSERGQRGDDRRGR